MKSPTLGRRIRMATMVRGVLPVPLPSDIQYSPLDIATAITNRLTERGHEVSFFLNNGDGPNAAHIESSRLRPIVQNNDDWQSLVTTADLFEDYIPSLYDQALVQAMFRRAQAGEYDVLHFHHPESAMPYARLYPKVPVLYTLHDELDPERREIIEEFASPNQHFVSISDGQRRGAPDLNYIDTVHNGIDTKFFKPGANKHEDYLLCVGRIVPNKGIREAIQVAQQTGKRLLIIGQLLKSEQWYFETHVKPHLSDKILYLGHMEHRQLLQYYQKACALLMPVQWEEPFGLTMIEAMACGTPVIALRRGSIPEIIVDGKTGFIVDSVHEMAEAVKKINKIDRAVCRRHVTRHFSVERMVDGYEKVLLSLAKERKPFNPKYIKSRVARTVRSTRSHSKISKKPGPKAAQAAAPPAQTSRAPRPKAAARARSARRR